MIWFEVEIEVFIYGKERSSLDNFNEDNMDEFLVGGLGKAKSFVDSRD